MMAAQCNEHQGQSWYYKDNWRCIADQHDARMWLRKDNCVWNILKVKDVLLKFSAATETNKEECKPFETGINFSPAIESLWLGNHNNLTNDVATVLKVGRQLMCNIL